MCSSDIEPIHETKSINVRLSPYVNICNTTNVVRFMQNIGKIISHYFMADTNSRKRWNCSRFPYSLINISKTVCTVSKKVYIGESISCFTGKLREHGNKVSIV